MTTRQKIDRARETRLWMQNIVGPVSAVVITAISVPEVRQAAVNTYIKVKGTVNREICKVKNEINRKRKAK